ncbi:MAG TPA: hypothetical protein VLC73_17110 [Burkholderiales bacterium]|nr:hypothetical protein [Burkholderiales bacterium]
MTDDADTVVVAPSATMGACSLRAMARLHMFAGIGLFPAAWQLAAPLE